MVREPRARRSGPGRRRAAGCALLILPLALTPAPSVAGAAGARPVALDIERLRVAVYDPRPRDEPTCSVLVVGGGLSGVAAAEALADAGVSVIVTEPTSQLGGQLTSQGICTPDEDRYIDRVPGSGTRSYRLLRDGLRRYYAGLPGCKPARAANVGQCWVSSISGTPAAWGRLIDEGVAARRAPGRLRAVLLRTQLVAVHRYPGNGRVAYCDVADLDTGQVTRIGAQYVIDASEMGDALALGGAPWIVGQEASGEYGEPDAPPVAHPEWRESFTYSFAARWTPGASAPIPPPDGYEANAALGRYSLAYDYPEPRGRVYYEVRGRAPGSGGAFWSYRRFVAAASFRPGSGHDDDEALINWQANDYDLEFLIGKTPAEQAAVLRRAKAYARGFLYWLESACPRDASLDPPPGGPARPAPSLPTPAPGYPEIQPDGGALGGDGFAPAPYLRDSRRLLALTPLTERDLIDSAPDAAPGRQVARTPPDAVGIGAYNIDIHPGAGQPPVLRRTLPWCVPLGAFVPRSGPDNLIPADKNVGASRLAAAALREHEGVWLVGEVAGRLAAFCLRRGVTPEQVQSTPDLLHRFQATLQLAGVPTSWDGIGT